MSETGPGNDDSGHDNSDNNDSGNASGSTVSGDDRHGFGDGTLFAEVRADGAELCALRDAEGRELLWGAGPAWPRHAPVLFPIVGRLAGDTLRHEGREHRLTQHGFARDRRFAWASRGGAACRLVLADDAGTRDAFPWPFRLEVGYAVERGMLRVSYRVMNIGDDVLPCSLGAHPAFRWPLVAGVAPEAHRVEFAGPEPAPVRRLRDGLLLPDAETSPVRGRWLALDPGLFAADAVIMDKVASRSLRYGVPGVLELEVAWEGFRQLGLWSRAGGEFLCIEPWMGFASPVDFDGEFADKPGLMLIPPGEARSLAWSVRVLA